MRMNRSTVRGLTWAALAGQLVFIASWIVAGALEPGYSHLDNYVSALGAKHAAHPWIVNTGIVVLGASIVGGQVRIIAALNAQIAGLGEDRILRLGAAAPDLQ